MKRAGLISCGALALCLANAGLAASAEESENDLRGLRLGQSAAKLSLDGFVDFACGSNGGPPRKQLGGWTEFQACAAEPSGLREVQVRFDDELSYWARANDDPSWIEKLDGTRVAGHPVVFSVLFDRDGMAEALRVVTDPRAPENLRRRAFLLRMRVMGRYGPEGWSCTDLPPEDRETPVANLFIKQRCEKIVGDRRHVLFTQVYRRAGQTGLMEDGVTPRPGDYMNSTRWEIWRTAAAR